MSSYTRTFPVNPLVVQHVAKRTLNPTIRTVGQLYDFSFDRCWRLAGTIDV